MSEEAAAVETVAETPEAVVAQAANERPENVPEKFWDTESGSVRNDDVLKSYNELSGKFGSFTGAPDTYEFSLSEELTEKGVTLDAESPLIANFQELAKESGMNQDMANKLVNMFVEGQYADSQSGEEAETQRVADEMALLGDNAQARVDNISKWANANMDPSFIEGIEAAAYTADSVKAIEALIALTRNAPVVNNDAVESSGITEGELKDLQFAEDEFGNRKMNDPAYRKMFDAKARQFWGDGENIITVGT